MLPCAFIDESSSSVDGACHNDVTCCSNVRKCLKKGYRFCSQGFAARLVLKTQSNGLNLGKHTLRVCSQAWLSAPLQLAQDELPWYDTMLGIDDNDAWNECLQNHHDGGLSI